MHTSYTEFEFDPAKATTNQKVSFAQAQEALRDQTAITSEDEFAIGERRFATLGADTTRRVLVVVHTLRGDITRLISARKASKGESEQYHAQ